MLKKYLTIALTLALVFPLIAQRNMDAVVIKPIQVTDNFYMLQGRGGNIGLFLGADGTLMIDDQFAPLAPKIMAVIDSLADKRVTYLINTHWHGDHTGGNAAFATEGATIVAHHNVRERLSTDQIRPFGRTTEAAPKIAWPTLTYSENMQVHINGESVQLIHHHNAHTDGDSFVYFPSMNVLHMGDTFFRGRFPFVDVAMGGSPDGLIAAVEAALMISDEDTKIVPGHGDLSSKQDLSDYMQMLKIMRDRVKRKISDNVALEDIDNEAITNGYEEWGTGFINAEKYVQMLYSYYTEE